MHLLLAIEVINMYIVAMIVSYSICSSSYPFWLLLNGISVLFPISLMGKLKSVKYYISEFTNIIRKNDFTLLL